MAGKIFKKYESIPLDHFSRKKLINKLERYVPKSQIGTYCFFHSAFTIIVPRKLLDIKTNIK
jgi:hypothetical protein